MSSKQSRHAGKNSSPIKKKNNQKLKKKTKRLWLQHGRRRAGLVKLALALRRWIVWWWWWLCASSECYFYGLPTHTRSSWSLVCFSLSRLAKARGKAIEKKKKEMSYLLAYGWRLNINSIKENGGDIHCDPGRDNRQKGGFDAIVDICRCKQICRQCDRITFSSRGGRLTSCSSCVEIFSVFFLYFFAQRRNCYSFSRLWRCQNENGKNQKKRKVEIGLFALASSLRH